MVIIGRSLGSHKESIDTMSNVDAAGFRSRKCLYSQILRREGKTLQQFEQELLDQELIRQAHRTLRQAVQVSPAAIKKYYRESVNFPIN